MQRACLDSTRAHRRCSYPLGLFLRGETPVGPPVPQPPERNRAGIRRGA